MSYPVALLTVLLGAGLAGLASAAVARLVSLDARRRYHEVGSVVFLQLGTIYAVLLAFVFSEVWGEYNTAKQAINAECAALHGSAMLAHDLPDRAGEPFDRAVAAYARAVIAEEWPLMARRQASPAALDAQQAMLAAAVNLPAAPPGGVEVRAQVVSLLAGAHAQQETRLFQMTQGMPAMLWALLILYTALLAGFVVLAGVESLGSHVFLAVAFTSCTVLTLVLIRMLDYPFEGALALLPTDFQGTLEKLSRLAAMPGRPG